MSFKPGAEKAKLSELFKNQAVVEVRLEGQAVRELPLLVLLGWYLIILRQDDSAAAAAAAAAAS